MADSFSEKMFGFSGPGQGCIDLEGTSETMLPITDGDATISVTEENFDVLFDQTGNTPRQQFRLGQAIEVLYPTKTADFEHCALTLRGDVTVGTTADPDASAALTTRRTIVAPTLTVTAKTAYQFDFWRISQPLFDSSFDPTTRTIDDDKFGLRINDAIFGPNGQVYVNRNGDSAITLKITGILPLTTDTLYRFFNTDLAVA